jgi:hypothetical protein
MKKILPPPQTPLLKRTGLALSASLAMACGDDAPAPGDALGDASSDGVLADVPPDSDDADADPFDGFLPPQPPPRDTDDAAAETADDVLPPPADTLEDPGPETTDDADSGDPFDGFIPPQPPPRPDAFPETPPDEP